MLSEKYLVNPKTIRKWKNRDYVHDSPMGPKSPHSTVLSREEEAICVVFRRHTLLPLDDCLYALQLSIPHLTRSSLHRLFQRHDISRLPELDATVKRYHYSSHEQLQEHLKTFVDAYNFDKRPKTLKGLTPYKFIINSWKNNPKLFKVNPNLHNMGPYNVGILYRRLSTGAKMTKDRRGRRLDYDDIMHYGKIINALYLTD